MACRSCGSHKVLAHRFFETQYSLWVDGSIRINVDIRALIDRYLDGADLALFMHPDRDCLYDELTCAWSSGSIARIGSVPRLGLPAGRPPPTHRPGRAYRPSSPAHRHNGPAERGLVARDRGRERS